MLFALVPESAPTPVEETRSWRTSSSTGRVRRGAAASASSARRGGYSVRGEATEEELRAAGVKPDAVVEFEDE